MLRERALTFFLCVAILPTTHGCLKTFENFNFPTNETYECAANFVRRNDEHAHEVVYVSDDEDLQHVIDVSKPVVISSVRNSMDVETYADMFVVLMRNEQEFREIFDALAKRSKSNTRLVFLSREVLSPEALLKIFRTGWKQFVVEMYVVTDGSIYTYFPYEHGKCGEDLRVESFDCHNRTIPAKVPRDLNGCEVRIMAFPMVPYVIDTNEDHGDPSRAGLEVKIMDVLAKKMNFNDVYVPNRHAGWGYKSAGGEYIMMYRSLYDREMDIKMGMSYGNASYLADFDGSYVYLTEKTVWWVPVALPIAQWKNITAIFEPALWLSIFIVLVANGIAWRLFGREEDSVRFRSLALCLMGSLCTLLQGSVPQPGRWKLRMIFVAWLYCCLLLFAAHQSSLVSILTTPLYDRQVSTEEELIEKYRFGFYEGALTAFDENSSLHGYIRNNYFQCPLSNLCMNFTAFDRDFAYYKNSRNVKYYLPRLYTSDERKLIYEIDGDGVGVWVRLHALKRFPPLGRIDQLLMQLQSNGLIGKWDADLSRRDAVKMGESEDRESLNVKHLQGAFFVLFLGVAVSFSAFATEMIRHSLKKFTFYYR